jgi:hypothetical protein
MLISKNKHFIFIHIYKNAGTSISNALLPFTTTPLHRNFNKILKKVGVSIFDPQPYHAHIHAAELMRLIGRENFRSYFSFAFVRNPWDWQVSLYTYALKTPAHHQHEFTKKLGSFTAYLDWRCTEDIHFQKDFIYSPDGELLVNFVGRYEHLEADFREICIRIGISASLPHVNVSKEKPYQAYYTPGTIELVRKAFASDIETFGYDFE